MRLVGFLTVPLVVPRFFQANRIRNFAGSPNFFVSPQNPLLKITVSGINTPSLFRVFWLSLLSQRLATVTG